MSVKTVVEGRLWDRREISYKFFTNKDQSNSQSSYSGETRTRMPVLNNDCRVFPEMEGVRVEEQDS